MTSEHICRTLKFEVYEDGHDHSALPDKSGIYCVYAIPNNDDDNASNNGIHTNLIYIGESGDVRDRIERHEKRQKWKRWADNNGKKLFYCCAIVPDEDEREAAESAMIAEYKPKFNFPFCKCAISDDSYHMRGEFKVLIMFGSR